MTKPGKSRLTKRRVCAFGWMHEDKEKWKSGEIGTMDGLREKRNVKYEKNKTNEWNRRKKKRKKKVIEARKGKSGKIGRKSCGKRKHEEVKNIISKENDRASKWRVKEKRFTMILREVCVSLRMDW